MIGRSADFWELMAFAGTAGNEKALKAHRRVIDCYGVYPPKEHPALVAALHNIPELITLPSSWDDSDKKAVFGEKHWSPLHYALHAGHQEVILALLEAGFDERLQSIEGHYPLAVIPKDSKTDIICFLSDSLHETIRGRNEELALRLINLSIQDPEGIDIVITKADSFAETPLQRASEKEMVSVVEKLLAVGADVSLVEEGKKSALDLAIDRGHEEIAKRLLDTPGVEKIINKVGTFGKTPLQRASEMGLAPIVEKLLKMGADITLFKEGTDSALDLAIVRPLGREAIAQSLLDAPRVEKIINKIDCFGNTPLEWASLQGFTSIVEKLLEKGADVTLVRKGGNSALDVAVQGGHEAIVKHLLDVPEITPLINRIDNPLKRPPLDSAYAGGHFSIAKRLLDKGANLDFVNFKRIFRDLFLRHKPGVGDALYIIRMLSSQGHLLKDPASVFAEAEYSPMTSAIMLEYFKPVLHVSLDQNHRYSKEDLDKMKENLYQLFYTFSSVLKMLLLSYMESEEMITRMIQSHKDKLIREYGESRVTEKMIQESSSFALEKMAPEKSSAAASQKVFVEISIERISKEKLQDYHRDGLLDIVELFYIAIVSYNPRVIEAFLDILETLPEERLPIREFFTKSPWGLLSDDESSSDSEDMDSYVLSAQQSKIFITKFFLYFLARSYQEENISKDERIKRSIAEDRILNAVAKYCPRIIFNRISEENKFPRKVKVTLDYVSSSHSKLQKFLLEHGANPFRGSPGETLYDRLVKEEHVQGLLTLFKYTHKDFSKDLSSQRLPTPFIVRLLAKMKHGNAIIDKMRDDFKIEYLIDEREQIFPVKPYTADAFVKLHHSGQLSLSSLLPHLFDKDYDTKILDACYQVKVLDFFTSLHEGGYIFHDIIDQSQFEDIRILLQKEIEACLMEPVSTPISHDKKVRRYQEIDKICERIISVFLHQEDALGRRPLDIYQENYPSLYNAIKELYSSDDEEICSLEVTPKDTCLFEEFKEAYAKHRSIPSVVDRKVYFPSTQGQASAAVSATLSAHPEIQRNEDSTGAVEDGEVKIEGSEQRKEAGVSKRSRDAYPEPESQAKRGKGYR